MSKGLHWTPEMYAAYQAKQAAQNKADEPKKSKYGNVKTEVGGIKFDSKKEAARWLVLRQMERLGDITDLQRQVEFEIIPALVIDGKKVRATIYRCDFAYMKDGQRIIEDVKGKSVGKSGMVTAEYRLKKKLVKHVHDIEILET